MRITKILFFDGACNLCNSSVDILIKLDRKQEIKFTSLQGQTAKAMNLGFEKLATSKQTLYYINTAGKLLSQSDALIEILQELFTFGFIFKAFKVIPKKVRNYLYSLIAKNRYKIFGKSETCRVPTEEERARFLV